jgi:hypothetical protein
MRCLALRYILRESVHATNVVHKDAVDLSIPAQLVIEREKDVRELPR